MKTFKQIAITAVIVAIIFLGWFKYTLMTIEGQFTELTIGDSLMVCGLIVCMSLFLAAIVNRIWS